MLLLVPTLWLSACGGGHSDSYDGYDQDAYIYWEGSVNGTLVVDATDDAFEFEIITGYLHFGNTTYTNAWVDSYGNFFVDGILVGGVYYVKSYYNETITALVSNNGYYIDIYGPESDLAWTEAPTTPIYAFKSESTAGEQASAPLYGQSALQSTGQSSEKATPPETRLNAYSDSRPKNNQGILRNK
jgi:hypothetical protein